MSEILSITREWHAILLEQMVFRTHYAVKGSFIADTVRDLSRIKGIDFPLKDASYYSFLNKYPEYFKKYPKNRFLTNSDKVEEIRSILKRYYGSSDPTVWNQRKDCGH